MSYAVLCYVVLSQNSEKLKPVNKEIVTTVNCSFPSF